MILSLPGSFEFGELEKLLSFDEFKSGHCHHAKTILSKLWKSQCLGYDVHSIGKTMNVTMSNAGLEITLMNKIIIG